MDGDDFMGRPQIVDINNIYDKEEDSTAGDRALIVAVLERAIRDLHGGVKGLVRDPKSFNSWSEDSMSLVHHRRSAIQWFLEIHSKDLDYDSCYTFDYCCLVLDIDKEAFKRKIFEMM
jgi:hypothetical protein